MLINADNLAIQLSQGKHKLFSVYLITGQELFIGIESADLITIAAKNAGYNEREVYYINSRFDFNIISDSLQAMSLFANKKLLEIRFETDKFAKKDAEKLLQIIKKPHDNIIIIQAINLNYKVQKESYFNELGKHAEIVNCPTIYSNKLGSWISARIARKNLKVTPDAINLIANAAQGNLFWCHQIIEQLQFIEQSKDQNSDTHIDSQMIESILSDQSVFQIGDLITALFNKSVSAKKILQKLKEDNESPILINAIISKDVEIIIALQQFSPIQVFDKYKVWKSKQAFYQSVSNNFDLETLDSVVYQLAELDKSSKGVSKQDEWLILEYIVYLLISSNSNLVSNFRAN